MQFWKRYSLFLALPRASVPKSFREGVVIDFQLGNLQKKENKYEHTLKKVQIKLIINLNELNY